MIYNFSKSLFILTTESKPMQSFKLTKTEEEALFKKSVVINTELIKLGELPMTESKIMHEILKQTLLLGDIEVTRNGEIRILSKNETQDK